MPLVNVHLAGDKTAEQKAAFMRAVTDAACEHLGVSASSVRVWITPIAGDNFMSDGVSLTERRAQAQAQNNKQGA